MFEHKCDSLQKTFLLKRVNGGKQTRRKKMWLEAAFVPKLCCFLASANTLKDFDAILKLFVLIGVSIAQSLH